MSEPFAYVLSIDHDDGSRDVSVHQSVREAENALYNFGYSVFKDAIAVGHLIKEGELVHALGDRAEYVRIHAVTKGTMVQSSVEIEVFSQAKEMA
jgi:hypothetical protein